MRARIWRVSKRYTSACRLVTVTGCVDAMQCAGSGRVLCSTGVSSRPGPRPASHHLVELRRRQVPVNAVGLQAGVNGRLAVDEEIHLAAVRKVLHGSVELGTHAGQGNWRDKCQKFSGRDWTTLPQFQDTIHYASLKGIQGMCGWLHGKPKDTTQLQVVA